MTPIHGDDRRQPDQPDHKAAKDIGGKVHAQVDPA